MRQNVFIKGIKSLRMSGAVLASVLLALPVVAKAAQSDVAGSQITAESLLKKMTLEQKIGQLQQSHLEAVTAEDVPDYVKEAIRKGAVGSYLNINTVAVANELQRLAVEESPHGIPLLIARDVIHGYKTIFPIPLGQAATWNVDAVEKGARIAATEASADGIRWTFAPMLDLSRDARWGRIAESFGEDPFITSIMGVASVKGYQGEDLAQGDHTRIAATAKHFLGYGAAEAGRDYNTTYIPEPLLHNQYLPPFIAAVEAGSASIMTAFNDLNGVPASISPYLMDTILRKKLGFNGVIVSDWDSVIESVVHGGAEDNKDAAYKAFKAGLDMEMVSTSFADNIADFVKSGKITEAEIDEKVLRLLRLKIQLGLFEQSQTDLARQAEKKQPKFHQTAREVAAQSLVLLKNEVPAHKKAAKLGKVLPLKSGQKIALIGPMADAAHDQLGTWAMDGEKQDSTTVLKAFEQAQADGVLEYRYAPGLTFSREKTTDGFKKAVKAAKWADVIVFLAGEEAALSGEAHSRANIRLPGAQEALLAELKDTGKPVVMVLMAGRQIELHGVVEQLDALVMAWHPGTMGGPAIVDVLTGQRDPVGRLPVTWPKVVGQLPMYYNHKNTGRPPQTRPFIMMDDYPLEAPQHSLGHAATHMDIGFLPQFPFGFGLGYSQVEYSKVKLAKNAFTPDEIITLSATIKNTGERAMTEVVQLYVQDVAGSVTRPVKELKAFERIELAPGETKTVSFQLDKKALMFFNAKTDLVFEPGLFRAWIAANSAAGEAVEFTVR